MRADQNPDAESGEAAREQEEAGEIDIRYNKGRDKPSDVRNVMLTIAVLLAAATYQAVLNPPGGIWQDEGNDNHRPPVAPSPATVTSTEVKQVPGISILATNNRLGFVLFMIGNTVGFLFSMNVIDDLAKGFARQLELRVAVLALCFSYGVGISIVTPNEYRNSFVASIYVVTLAIVGVIRLRREKSWARC